MPPCSQHRAGLAAATKARENLLRAFAEGLVSTGNAAALNDQLLESQRRADTIRARIAEIERGIKDAEGQAVDAREFARGCARLMASLRESGDRPPALRQFVRACVRRIERRGSAYSVRYAVPAGSTTGTDWHPNAVLVDITVRAA